MRVPDSPVHTRKGTAMTPLVRLVSYEPTASGRGRNYRDLNIWLRADSRALCRAMSRNRGSGIVYVGYRSPVDGSVVC